MNISDEFSSQDEDDEISSRNSVQGINRRQTPNPSTPKIISRCKAIYAYSPKLDDELEINPGKLNSSMNVMTLFVLCKY